MYVAELAPAELGLAVTASDNLAARDVRGTDLFSGSKMRLLDLVELILKDRPALERILRTAGDRRELVPRFLAIAVASFAMYSLAMTFVMQSADTWPHLALIRDVLSGRSGALLEFRPNAGPWPPFLDGSVFHILVAYTCGLIASTGICLPSLYFYGLLAGVRMSMLDVVLHAVKAKATAAIALIALLPIYAAVAMGAIVLGVTGTVMNTALLLGLILPFIAGLWGTWSLYRGFLELCDVLSEDRRERRACFLRRLVLSWACCYTAVSPVMIYTIWEYLGRS